MWSFVDTVSARLIDLFSGIIGCDVEKLLSFSVPVACLPDRLHHHCERKKSSEYLMLLHNSVSLLCFCGVSPVSCVLVHGIIDFLHKSSMMPQTFHSDRSHMTQAI